MPLLAFIIVLGVVVILAPIVAEYQYACRRLAAVESESLKIAPRYRYMCWVTGTAMIAASIVLLFRLEW